MDFAIQAINLTKRFQETKSYSDMLLRPFARRETTALDGVSLDVKAGETFAIVGPNGAGKTALIKILSALVLPTSGEAFVAGYDVKRHPDQVKRRIGCVVAEERSFYWRLTGRQNLNFFAVLNNIPKASARRRVNELIALVGLEKDADRMFKDYSTGMRHRLAIARALLTDPEIVFFDEPTKSLDPPAAEAVRNLIWALRLREPRRTVLFATHDLSEAESLADRVAVLDRGRVKASGTPAGIREAVCEKRRYGLKLRQPSGRVTDLLMQLVSSCRLNGDGAANEKCFVIEIGDSRDVSFVLRELVLAGAEVVECVRGGPSLDRVFNVLTGSRV